MYCGEQTAVKGMGKVFIAVSLKCNAWTCPECSDVRKRRLTGDAIAGHPNRFLTLTSRRREGMTPNEAAAELARCWRLVRKRMMRLKKWRSMPFLAVFEATQLGWPHLHILLRCGYFDIKLIKLWMAELSGSPVCWIEHIENARKCAFYCAKYCSKATTKFGTSKRYWQSKDYRCEAKRHKQQGPDVPGDWYVFKWHVARWIDSMRSLGASIEFLGNGKVYAALPGALPPARAAPR